MRIGRSVLGVLATNLLNLVLSLGNSIFLTRTLGPVGKGEFAVFVASSGVLSLLLGLGLNTSLRYYVAKRKVPLEKILTSLVAYVFLVGIFVFVVASWNRTLLVNEILLPRSKQNTTFELALALVVMANLFYANVASVFAGRQSFRMVNLASVGYMALSLVGYASLYGAQQSGLLAIGSDEVFLLYLLLTVLNGVLLGALAYRVLGVAPSRGLLDRGLILGMLRYGSMAWVAQVTQFLNYRIDIWIVQHLCGAAALGLYSLAGNLAMMLWTLPRATSTVLMPATAADHSDAGQAARLSRLVFLTTGFVAFPAALTAREWLRVLYGSAFADASVPLVVLLVGCVPFSVSVILAGSLTGSNRLDVNLLASGVGLVVTVALDLILIPGFGIVGAAVASSASYVTTSVLVALAFSRIHSVPLWSCFVPAGGDLQYVLGGLKGILR